MLRTMQEMGFHAEYVLTHCKELHEQYLKHMAGDEPEQKVEHVPSSDGAGVPPASIIVPATALVKESVNYMMALRDQRREAYNFRADCKLDENGIPTRTTCILHQGTWQSWFSDIETKVSQKTPTVYGTCSLDSGRVMIPWMAMACSPQPPSTSYISIQCMRRTSNPRLPNSSR